MAAPLVVGALAQEATMAQAQGAPEQALAQAVELEELEPEALALEVPELARAASYQQSLVQTGPRQVLSRMCRLLKLRCSALNSDFDCVLPR